jgi:hypothetical protein
MECASIDRWLGDKLEDKTLDSPDTAESCGWLRLDLRLEARLSSATYSLTLLVRLLGRRFLSGFSLDLSVNFARSLRILLLVSSSAAAPASAPVAAAAANDSPRDGLEERLTSVEGPEPSRKLSAGMAEISEALAGL